MQFPQHLVEQLEQLLKNFDNKHLIKHTQKLTSNYKSEHWKLTAEEKLCYAAMRMPATFAVISHLAHNLSFNTILDVGAGPGTASFALKGTMTCLEQDADFIAIAKQLGSKAQWQQVDCKKSKPTDTFDLVLFSYSYGEMPTVELAPFWNCCERYLLIIEPGTPKGWQNILQARETLIQLGAYIQAPCPHHRPCPLIPPDWCHFGIRLERSFMHRFLKQGSLNYEEEKFSYLLASKTISLPRQARILRPPQKRPGHIHLKLCTEEGLQLITLGKKDPLYVRARSAKWGENF